MSQTTTYYRSSSYQPQATQQTAGLPAHLQDDYERWYTESTHSNRMVLALRSGIDTEIAWALDRLCRLCVNDVFNIMQIPRLIDALFEWPEWFVTEGYKEALSPAYDLSSLFSLSGQVVQRKRHALESLIILRTSSLMEHNAQPLAKHSHTIPLIEKALLNLDAANDEHVEFILNTLDLFVSVGTSYTLPPRSAPKSRSILHPLLHIASTSSNRTLIISSLSAISLIFSNSQNTSYLSSISPALDTAIRYLPLLNDKPLLEAAVNYLYTHLSNTAMSRAFLRHPSMPTVLKMLVSLLLAEQVEETVQVDVTGTVHTVPLNVVLQKDRELTEEEFNRLLPVPEPQRCYEWMQMMFVAEPDAEVTQVDFWNLYKDTFCPYSDKYPPFNASDVIKSVTNIFPAAQAMVVPGPPQRFIVRGVNRRKVTVVQERLKCHWDRSQCPLPAFATHSELCKHISEHVNAVNEDNAACLWSECLRSGLTKKALCSHVLTHLPSPQTPDRHPSQSDTITLSSPTGQYPTPNPTARPPPPLRSTVITYNKAAQDPPPTSLTALLCIRILFRASFASVEAAPRIDEDHFGFPGIVEDFSQEDVVELTDEDKDGERKGRKAFLNVKSMMERVQMKDEILMDWILEMVDIDAMIPGMIQ
ncbi:rsc complex subunit rsc9 [Moniliophthora roreri MCA 2997]|uniref:Rsc complex subunit rsc9 n=1 Tax=Moniliophthora roreri (strain MCA 2997) TaxID=1381753 RepID=V2XEK8_MONRO|nr:rsc complex subunit rsc9 [Moniliophthora roreri MCA 2997]